MTFRSPHSRSSRYRWGLLISLVLLIPIGYSVRFAQTPAPAWLHDALGSVVYEVAWIVLFGLCFPRVSVARIAIAVCLATVAIEFLQLWQPPVLVAIRATLPGRLVLGNQFSWTDFPAYFIGSVAGWLWVTWLQKRLTVEDRKV